MNNPYFGQFLKSKLVRIYILEILKYIKETKTRRYIIFSISCGLIAQKHWKLYFYPILVLSLDYWYRLLIFEQKSQYPSSESSLQWKGG